NTLTVYIAIALQVVHHFGKGPRPDADGAPAVAIAMDTGLSRKPNVETIVHRVDILPVELKVSIVGSSYPVPSGKYQLNGPPRRESSPALLVCVASRKARLFLIACPSRRDSDIGVSRNGLVSGKVQPHKHGHGFFAVVG